MQLVEENKTQSGSQPATDVSDIEMFIELEGRPSFVRFTSFSGGAWTFEAEDPFDFISDAFELHSIFHFNFEKATVSYYVPFNGVSRDYVDAHADYVKNNKILVYKGGFSDAVSLLVNNTPVHQHCYRYVQLFMNACSYLRTLQSK